MDRDRPLPVLPLIDSESPRSECPSGGHCVLAFLLGGVGKVYIHRVKGADRVVVTHTGKKLLYLAAGRTAVPVISIIIITVLIAQDTALPALWLASTTDNVEANDTYLTEGLTSVPLACKAVPDGELSAVDEAKTGVVE